MPLAEAALDPAVSKAAKDWADLFRKLAAHHGFSLLGLEMAVIADKRRQALSAPSFFTSYVTMFSEQADALHVTYQDCINRAHRKGAAREGFQYKYPIVVHPELYEAETGYFHGSVGVGPSVIPNSSPDGVLKASGYPLRKTNNTVPDRAVADQLGDVVKILGEVSDPLVEQELRGSSLVVLPFMRPKYSPARDIATSQDLGATPGGCIFFILRDMVDPQTKNLRAFLANARWVLAEASASESQSAYDAVMRQREFAAAMLHGTVSAISAIGISNIIDLLFLGDADKQVLSVHDLIINFDGPPDQVAEQKRQIVSHLQRMLIAEPLAASLTRFAEIHADEGMLRKKFLSDKDESLRELVEKSWKIAVAAVGKTVALVGGRDDDEDSDWILPSGYVSSDLLLALMMELFRNGIEHVAGQETGRKIELSIFERGGSVIVQVANDAPSSREAKPPLSGFLVRASMLLDHIRGLDLESAEGDGIYVAKLALGEINAEHIGPSSEATRTVTGSRPQRKSRHEHAAHH